MSQPTIIDFDAGISAVDTEYLRRGLDASHLIIHEGRAAFVDTGTNHAVPLLLAALEAKGLAPEQVDWVLVTHVHLDHAGGAGALMQALPNATAVLHPRGAPHMADPSKLVAGSKAVYGEALFNELYGEIRPIPAGRIRAVEDAERIELAGRPLELIHTEGHARHHYCIVDFEAQAVFTGDSFGLSYRWFDTAAGPFIFPTTTPVHFDPGAAHEAIRRILSYEPARAFLTHFSGVDEPAALAPQLHRDLDEYERIALEEKGAPDPKTAIQARVRDWTIGRLMAHGVQMDDDRRDELIANDMDLNAQGLAFWAGRQE
jgi:glyoxylase-like metal-dependent hydrolase (beta-lactamase superfamily II)